jgi:predicted ATPase/class 3 adenylate cyclase
MADVHFPRSPAYACAVRRLELPSGTVTFLFTDIEGSTRLLDELGDGYADVLAEHRRALRDAFERNGGVEVDTQGDAFFVAFPRASDAVSAAQAGQDALRAGPVRVRMGLHTGEPMLTEENYVGMDVHRGARVASAGHGGQVLLSQTTRDLLDSSFELVDLGLHRLKDLSEPQRLFQLGTEEFPPLKTLHQTNLPVPATPFLGRERELGEVLGLLRSSRVLTLTGPGGSGKTRLALQTAGEAADDFPAGVWWVPLSTLQDPSLVCGSIAQVLGSKNGLADHIADKELLLLLDNLEHLLDATPELAALLERCSGLRLLATSREPLRLSAEQEYPVAPFASGEAVDFFCARARAARPDFEPTAALPDICRRLDNLPLALELAAARVKILSSDQILARLEQALPLLTGGPSDAPERQRTLAATIAWSHEMLSDSEQALFASLSVFVGGCTLEAAEAVCDADVDGLASLVDKSLVRQSGERFWMLETIREFALERLREHGLHEELRRRHADYFLAGAEANFGRLFETLTQEQLDWFEREQDNLRAAFDRLHEPDAEPELEARLVLACAKFWSHRGFWSEERRRHDAVLERADGVPPLLRGRLLWEAAEILWSQGDYRRAKDLAEAAIALLDRLGTATLDAIAARNALAATEQHLGNLTRATELFESSAALARAAGNELLLATALSGLGNQELEARNLSRARVHLEEVAAIARRRRQEPLLANTLVDLGFVALEEAAVEEAAAQFQASLSICRAARATHTLVWAVEGLAAVALAGDGPALATRLLAATGSLRAEIGFAEEYYTIGNDVRERTLEAAREKLGEAEFAAALAEGQALSIDEAADAAALVA